MRYAYSGITARQEQILRILEEHPWHGTEAVADLACLPRHRVREVLRRLVKRGVVKGPPWVRTGAPTAPARSVSYVRVYVDVAHWVPRGWDAGPGRALYSARVTEIARRLQIGRLHARQHGYRLQDRGVPLPSLRNIEHAMPRVEWLDRVASRVDRELGLEVIRLMRAYR